MLLQVVQSRAHIPTLPDNKSTSELEPADAKLHLQPQSLSGAATSYRVDLQQRSSSCSHSQHRDHCDDNDRTSSLEHPHLFTLDNRGESIACSLTLPDDKCTSELELADAKLNPANAKPIGLQQRTSSSHLSHLS